MKTASFVFQGSSDRSGLTRLQRAWRNVAAVVLLCVMAAPAFAQKWETAAPIPQGAEEVYGVAANGKLYVFGGLALAWKPIGMVMEYDPAKNAWTRKKDMPAPHHHFALTELNGKIYVFGGYQLPPAGQPTWIPVDNSWEYDPQADTWKALAPVPQARGSANALTVNGRIHLIGGATLPAGHQGCLHPSVAQRVGHHARSLRSGDQRVVEARRHADRAQSRRLGRHQRQDLHRRRPHRFGVHPERLQRRSRR